LIKSISSYNYNQTQQTRNQYMEIKRVQAPLTNIRPEMVKPKPSAQTPAQTPQKNL